MTRHEQQRIRDAARGAGLERVRLRIDKTSVPPVVTLTGRATYLRLRDARGEGYRYGRTADALARDVAQRVQALRYRTAIVKAEDHWAPWPADSFFHVVVSMSAA